MFACTIGVTFNLGSDKAGQEKGIVTLASHREAFSFSKLSVIIITKPPLVTRKDLI